MAEKGIYGHGLTITVDGVPIVNVHDVTFNRGANEQVDVTSHSSPARRREFISGMKGQGTLGFGIYWDPADAGHQALETAYDNGDEVAVVLTFPDTGGQSYSFDALVSLGDVTSPHDGAMKITPVTLTITGDVT